MCRNWGIAGVLILVVVNAALAQTTWYVDDNGAGDPGPGDPGISDPLEDGNTAHPFDAIQEGITAAQDGDVVLVKDGVYTGAGNNEIEFQGKLITVRSENGAATCTINGGNYARGFHLHENETHAAIIDGFTLEDCRSNAVGDSGGAIQCWPSAPTIRNCVVHNSYVADGAAIYCREGAPVIVGCEFEGNQGTVGTVHLLAGGRVAACTFHGNTVNAGGAVVGRGGHTEIVNCEIRDNYAFIWGGGVVCLNGSTEIVGCTIVGNEAPVAGGVAMWAGAVVTMSNCVVWDPTSATELICVGRSPYGGADLHVEYCDIEGGIADVYVYAGSNLDWGDGNIDSDPMFVHEAGGDLRLAAGSPCIDAGSNFAIPRDVLDLDEDGCLAEPCPVDAAWQWRFHDDPESEDSGVGYGPIADMGAYEYDSDAPVPGHACPGDPNCDGVASFDDIAPFVVALGGEANYYTQYPNCNWLNADCNRDGTVDFDDINAFVGILTD